MQRAQASVSGGARLNITGVASVFNVFGYKYFDSNGYIVYSDVNATRFRDGPSFFGNPSKTVALGTSSFSDSMEAFIFMNSSIPLSYSLNYSEMSRFLSLGGNSTVTGIGSLQTGGIPVNIYSISTTAAGPNGTVEFTDYASAFSYENVLFVGHFQNLSHARNATSYLAAYLAGGR